MEYSPHYTLNMTKNSTVDGINRIIKKHGSNLYGDPLFRVVFSDDQTENRRGIFDEYSGPIFIRRVKGIKEVKKYPWIQGKWILERWASGEIAYHPDLESDKNGVYVCVYVFQDVNQNYLPPLLKVTEIVIRHLLNPRHKADALNQDFDEEKKQDEKEYSSILEDLQIQRDEVATKDKKSYRDSMSVGYVKEKE